MPRKQINTPWILRVLQSPIALLEALDFAVGAALLIALLSLAVFGPAFVAREYFGGWLSAGTLLASSLWALLVAYFVREWRRGNADALDAGLLAVTTLFYLWFVSGALASSRGAV